MVPTRGIEPRTYWLRTRLKSILWLTP